MLSISIYIILILLFFTLKKFIFDECNVYLLKVGLIVFFLVHSLGLIFKNKVYIDYDTKVKIYQEMVDQCRNNGGDLSSNSFILKDIVSINIDISNLKRRNKNLILDQYIDDRFETMEPIKY